MASPLKVLKRFLLAKSAIQTLEDAGHEAWLVGGAVRDLVMEKTDNKPRTPKDFDLATSCDYETVVRLFPFPGHGEVTKRFMVHAFKIEGETLEIASFRDDSQMKTRKGDSPLPGTMETDALRRDFRMNSMYWNPISGELKDPLGGVQDIENGVINSTTDPEFVFTQDPVRVVRAVRFQRRFNMSLGFDLDRFRNLVDWDSDRVKQELRKG